MEKKELTLDDRLTPNVDVVQLQKQDNEEKRDTHRRPRGSTTNKRQANNKKKRKYKVQFLCISKGECTAGAGASNTCPNQAVGDGGGGGESVTHLSFALKDHSQRCWISVCMTEIGS